MSFSADTCFEPPNKLPRYSLTLHHHHISTALFSLHHNNISYSAVSVGGESSSGYWSSLSGYHQYHQQTLTNYPLLVAREGGKDAIINTNGNGSNNCYYQDTVLSNNSSAAAPLITASSSIIKSCDAATAAATSSALTALKCSLHPGLQPQLWCKLPQELIEHILAFLPVPSIFRFSQVCRSWRSLFFSRTFLRLRAQLSDHISQNDHRRHGAYFLALNRSRYQQLSAYEVVSKKWYSFPLDFLPSVAYPIAAAGGLICFLSSNMETGYNSLIVCNPLTKQWKELPSMLNKRMPFSISMAIDRKAMSYKILVAGGLEDAKTTEMYDSTTGTWTSCGPLPQDEEISRCMVEYCGYYLCLTRGPGSGLLAFNLKTQVWIKMRTGRIPGYSKFRHLVECGGSILVIGKALRRYVLGLYIWCLDPTTLRWREVGKMPRAICDQFFSSPSECFYCTAQGQYIFFSRYFYNQGIVYNTVENSWQQVAGCPLLTHPLLLPFSPGLDPVD